MTTPSEAWTTVKLIAEEQLAAINGGPPPPNPLARPDRAPSINKIEPPVPGPGLWRVSFASPTEPPAVQEITIPANWPNATLYCGDPGFADMAVEVDGIGVISNGTPQCPFPGAPGTYRVSVSCVNNQNTLEHGCGPVGIYIRETP